MICRDNQASDNKQDFYFGNLKNVYEADDEGLPIDLLELATIQLFVYIS